MSDRTDDRIAALERRIANLEAECAVRHLLVRYGLAVDTGDVAATIALYSEDCHIDIDGVVFMNGRQEARGIVESDVHQALLPYCAHIMGPFDVVVDGDHAVATGYGTVFIREGDGRVPWRQSFGRWELVRCDGRWEITRRTSRSLGHAGARAIVAPALGQGGAPHDLPPQSN